MIEIEMANLKRLGIDLDKIKQYQVLCLPENIEKSDKENELFDANDSANLSKMFKKAGLNCANSYDLGLKSCVLERRSADLWFGLILILDKFAIPVIVGVISGLLTNVIVKKSDSNKPVIMQNRSQKIHITLFIQRDNNFIKINFDGDPLTLKNILNAINEDVKKNEEN